jgi:hypothetical protein
LAPFYDSLYLQRIQTWQVGFESLGVHQLVYACRDLFVSDLGEIHSNSTYTAIGQMPIIVSPTTVLMLIHEIAEKLELARESSSEMGSITSRPCLSWEANHTRSWSPGPFYFRRQF